ncbi:MAG: D-alanine--poly(phosphoribitol) ligase, partial [Candidatus Latescibacterota bacterium]
MAWDALHAYFIRAAKAHPERTAVEEIDGLCLTYKQLDGLSDRVRDRLRLWGVGPGDRVGLYMRKSIDAVASMYGALKCGAAYVPVDPGAPAARDAFVLSDCAVRAVVVEDGFAEGLRAALATLGKPVPRLLPIGEPGGGSAIAAALDREDREDPAPA